MSLNTPHSEDNTDIREAPEWILIEAIQNTLANKLRQHDAGKNLSGQTVLANALKLLQGGQGAASATQEQIRLDIASKDIDYWELLKKRKGSIGTGLSGLNDLLSGGLEPQRMLVLLGAPGGGKTTLANQIAVHVADSGRPVLYVTSEDIPYNLLSKTIARQARVNYKAVLKGYQDEPETIGRAIDTYRASLAGERLHYYDVTRGVFDLAQLAETARVHFEKYKEAGEGIIIFDYLQKLAKLQPLYRAGTIDKITAVSNLSTEMRDIAVTLDCTVLALASQNRASGYKADDNSLSSAKESGDIEYAADVLMTLGDDKDRNPTNSFLLPRVLRIDKNRQGETGILKLEWYGALQEFTEYDKEQGGQASTPASSNGRKRR